MDSQRTLIVIALLFVSWTLFQQWQNDYAHPNHLKHQHTTSTPTSLAADLPVNDLPTTSIPITETTSTLHDYSHAEQHITVSSDVLSLTINTQGGDIVQAKLLSYPAILNQPEPLALLTKTNDFLYQAQSGLIGPNGPDSSLKGRPRYQAQHTHYQLGERQSTLQVPLTYRDNQGVLFTKTFILRAGDYAIDVVYQVNNSTANSISVQLFGQLKQQFEAPKTGAKRHFALQTYRGGAYSAADTNYKKYDFSSIKKTNLAQTTQSGWVAMLQQYFLTAWIPEASQTYHFYSKNLNNQYAMIGFKGEPVHILPGTQQQLQAKLWLGPTLQEKMAAVAKHLDLTVDYGWLWFISQPLFKLLKFLQRFVGNWGVAIIGITFIVRGIMYPLTKAQYTSMAKMRMLQPKLLAMRERLEGNHQRLSQEMMALYKQEKVNPFGGCLPLLVQMPIFLALYWMLMGSVELRHASFFGWIHDLSAPDPYYILPLLMGMTMFIIQKMSPTTTTDPFQQKIMNIMPAIFTVFFLWFPSGLVLYYAVSNIVTILQQQMIFNHLEKKGLRHR